MLLDASIAVSEECSRRAWDIMNQSCQRFYDHAANPTIDHSKVAPMTLLDQQKSMTSLCWDDIGVEMLLGAGGFNDIYRVKVTNPSCRLLPWVDNNDTNVDVDTVSSYYALKCVSSTSVRNFETDYIPIAADLALEAAILGTLQHKHIITIHGSNSCADPKSMQGHFILLDLLEETLEQQFDKLRRSRQIFSKKLTGGRSILERLRSSTKGICDAMNYLHQKGIVHRDLKPGNIGFDNKGIVKLFDFGLARHEKDSNVAIAGSLRYMAPETIMVKGCDQRSDIYSFGLLLYETVTLSKPYSHITQRALFIRKVVDQNYRPPFRSVVPSSTLASLICACWSKDPKKRPTFSRIMQDLEQVEKELHHPETQKLRRLMSNSTISPTASLRSWKLRHTISMPIIVPSLFNDEETSIHTSSETNHASSECNFFTDG